MTGIVPALRPYQVDLVDRFSATVAAGRRRPLLVLATGGGKTIVLAAIIAQAVAERRRVLFLAHRRELITQASAKLHAAGVDHGILQAGFPGRPGEPVQVASIATLHARAIRSRSIELPPADLVVVDEAHHSRARTYRRVIEAYPEAVILGVTATPCRGDGKGLGNAFDTLIEGPPVSELISAGYLVPTRVYAPTRPDLTGVRVERGDYVEKQLAERMDTATLTGDIVSHWHRLAERRRTVVFATGVGHSMHLRDQFRASGVLAEHIDGGTPAEERDAILRRLAEGKIDVVCNCAVLTEGWDSPEVSCLVLARPTKSIGLYRQMVGRVLRPAEGKTEALILDHAGAIFEHGFVEEPIAWSLDEDRRAENATQKARSERRAPSLVDCPECKAVRFQGSPCTACGWRQRARSLIVDVADGELGQVDRNRRVQGQKHSPTDMHRFHGMLAWIAREKGYAAGWIGHKYREKFKDWPKARTVDPIPPDDATRSWIRSRQIAFARARNKQRGAA